MASHILPLIEETGASCNVAVKGNKNKQNVTSVSPFDEDLMQTRKVSKLPFIVE